MKSIRYDALFKGSMILLTLMIFAMVIVGGITRLTGSGLSIVEWKPIVGIFPPLSLEAWWVEFEKYQHSPEFQKINRDMSLSGFQSIYWLEYIHRLVGRFLGLIFLIPTFLMVVKKQHRDLWPLLALLWVLGALQGFMGWLMVKSGLIYDPYVSPYRLAAHLLLGFAIFGVALWMTLSLYKQRLPLERRKQTHLKTLLYIALSLILLTAFMGALVAGLKAGLLYPTFPLMGERLIPEELFQKQDFLQNPVSVQFFHRTLALLTVLYCGGLWVYQYSLRMSKPLAHAFTGVIILAFLQFSLGIATLLQGVPIGLAIFHQGFAFVLFGSILYTLFLLCKNTTDAP